MNTTLRTRGSSVRTATLALSAVLLLGLLVRLPLAWVDMRVSADMEVYFQWGQAMRTVGPGMVYEVSNTVSPPLLISLLGFAALFQPGGEHPGPLFEFVVKSASMLADVLTAGLIALYVRRYSPGLAPLAAALYLFNPAIWYVSSVWGQTDSLYTFFLVASVLLLERDRIVPAWIVYALAFATKLQSFAFAPLLFACTVARGRQKGWNAPVAGVLSAAALLSLIALPWITAGTTGSLLRVYTSSPEARVDTSAFNLWYLLFMGDTQYSSSLDHPLGLFLSYQGLGLLLFGLFALAVSALVVLRRMPLFMAAAALGTGMFALVTEMHERHLFPAIAFLLLAAFGAPRSGYILPVVGSGVQERPSRPLLWAYGLLSLSYLFNIVTIATLSSLGWLNLLAPQPETWHLLLLKGLSFVASLLNLALLAWLVLVPARQSAPGTRAREAPDYA